MITARPLPWSFFGTAPRRVEVDVFAGIATASTRSTSVDLAGLVVDVGTLAGFRRDIAAIGGFVSTGVVGAVSVLQVAFSCVVGAVVFVAGVAIALAKAVGGSIRIAGLDADAVDGLRGVTLGHGYLLWSGNSNAHRELLGTATPANGQRSAPEAQLAPAFPPAGSLLRVAVRVVVARNRTKIAADNVASRPVAKHGQVPSALGLGTVDGMVTGSLRAAVGRHSALLLEVNGQSQNLTSIYLHRLYKGLVPIRCTASEDRAASRSKSLAFTTRHGG